MESFRSLVEEQSGVLFPGIPEKVVSAWIDRSIGTTHKFQGGEMETAILLLGGNPSNPGGIRWAGGTPNILNVAATRAKLRFYVIGDKQLWSQEGPGTFGAVADMPGFPTILAEPSFVRQVERREIERISTLAGHLKVMEAAFTSAVKFVVITSPWVGLDKLTDKSLAITDLIRKATARGLSVGIYLDPKKGVENREGKYCPKKAAEYKEAKALLASSGAIIREAPNIHNKTLIIDYDVIVEGSFNWLSASRNQKSSKYESSLCYRGKKAKEFIIEATDQLRERRDGGTGS